MMPEISFQYPQFLVLLLLLPLVRRFLARSGASFALRFPMAALAVFALSRPRLGMDGPGSDLLVLVDRSASCAVPAERMLRELRPLIRNAESPGDRSAVVAFGDGALVEQGFAGGGEPQPAGFEHASDVAAALKLAAGMRQPDRRTAVLCLSDGLYTGENPLESPEIAGRSFPPFWYRRVGREGGTDAAAGEIVLPGEAEVRSAWLVRYAIHADAPVEAGYILSRNGLVLARRQAVLRPGPNHFFARDTAEQEGILHYRLEVTLPGDAVPRNNRSEAILRVRGAEKALVVSSAETPGLLARSLEATAIPFDSLPPEKFPDSPAFLEPYRLVILENCRLTDFPGGGALALAAAVDAGLASLLITGGPDSFGTGGYHRSPVDPFLPVELELRNERRRGTTAVAIALDRSGSMAAEAGNGRIKMDIANLGAAESIRLLSPRDQAAVIAVDSQPHVVVPLSLADDVEGLARLIRGIQSMGGGIYCRAALEAAAGEIRKSTLSNRHIILFADADDAEDQDGCLELAGQLRREGVGLSVIAMGATDDSDADFLRKLAAAGGGEALFSSHAGGLPALFTQEIMRVSRRGFLEEPVTPRLAPSFAMLGVPADSPPQLGGVNVSSAREGTLVFMDIDDEFATPLLAARANGRSWTGAALFELDGRHSGSFPSWPRAPELIASLSRLLASGVNHARVKAYSRLDRGVAEVRFEFFPEAVRQFRNARPVLKWLGRDGLVAESELEWVEPGIAAARIALIRPGAYLPLADLGDLGVAPAPPLSLSYSPEYAPDSGRDGLALLRNLAAVTGGDDGLDISEVRRSARAERTGVVELRPFLIAAFLLAFLLELSMRRLFRFS